MQEIGNQLGSREALSVSQVASLLAISRTAVEKRRFADLPLVDDGRPARVAVGVAVAAYEAALKEAEGRVERLIAAYRANFPGQPIPTGSSGKLTPNPDSEQVANWFADLQNLREELSEEKAGRAVAEARIDELRSALGRANAAIQALMLNPDINPDLP